MLRRLINNVVLLLLLLLLLRKALDSQGRRLYFRWGDAALQPLSASIMI